MNTRLPVGVIGLGRMGQIYSEHLARHVPQAQLVYVSDVIEERAQALSAELGVETWSTDYRDLVGSNQVKAVFVASPTSTHRKVVIAAAEARGFLFAAPLALELDAALVPIRKPGKLPFETISHTYELEYGTDTLEIHVDAIPPGAEVLVVDDLLATGGTVEACCKLVEKAGGKVLACAFVIELAGLRGAEKIAGYEHVSLIRFP